MGASLISLYGSITKTKPKIKQLDELDELFEPSMNI
jgi:hypothetical protein